MMIRLTKEVHAKLKMMSEKLGMPMSQCVNMLVTQWLSRIGNE